MRNKFILLFLLGVISGNIVSAQMVGGNCYLQGHWLEFGMLPNASFGAPPAPAGYHSSGNLGEIYDLGHDGWTVGSPVFNGDYTYPGSPFEGWELQVNGLYNQAFVGAGYSGTGSLTGAMASYSNTGGRIIGNWAGTASTGGLIIKQETRVDTQASWVVVTTYMHNITSSPMPGVYYFRSADPDNDVDHGGGFNTDNTIAYQNDIDHRVEVDAYGITNSDHFDLCTKDMRARCLIYTSWPLGSSDLSTLWGETYGVPGSSVEYGDHNTLDGDYAIGLVYNIGTIAAGDSAIVSYAYTFNGIGGIDSAFPEPEFWVGGAYIAPTGPAPAPSIDTFKACEHPGVTSFTVDIKTNNGTDVPKDKCWTWSNWSWSPSTGITATGPFSYTVNLSALSSTVTTFTITGDDSTGGMKSGAHRVFYLTVIKCFSASSNSPSLDSAGTITPADEICEGNTLQLFAHGDSLGATYQWYHGLLPGTTTVIGTIQNLVFPSAAVADDGWYTVVRTIGAAHDTAKTQVTIKLKPVIIATTNGPICSGSTLDLFSNPDSVGETWQWYGPDGFNSTASDPSLPAAITAYSGGYKVIASLHGCMDSATVFAEVDSTPTVPMLFSNTPVCSGFPLNLTSIESTAGVSYQWNGPGSFTSFVADPTIPFATVGATGVYTLTVKLGECTNTNTTAVTVNPTPMPVLSSNAPVCSQTSLNLMTTGDPGSTYSWSGPNSFSSTLENPVIDPAATSFTGTYSVVVTLNDCPSAVMTIYAAVDTTPVVPVVSTNSPGPPGATICQGDTLFLYAASATSASNYLWGGPNSFTSTAQNPVILGAIPAASGVYTVTASIGACSVSATLSATVTPTPALIVTSNSPICTGVKDTVFLLANGDAGAAYSWDGPYVFTSSAQNPFRTPAIAEYGGIYNIHVLFNGCTHDTSMNVVVNETPDAPTVKWLTFCQYHDADALQAYGSNILWYSSSAAGSAGTAVPPVPSTTNTGWTFYYASQTVNNCTSAIDSIKVQVNPKPVVSVAKPLFAVCPRDSITATAIDEDPIAYYHWTPSMYVTDTSSATTTIWPETDIMYSVIATNQYGCTDTATVSVTVHPSAVTTLADSVTLYPGETYQMDPVSNCSSFLWTPSGGLSSSYIMNPVASPEISTRYYLYGVTEFGCKTKDSIDVMVNTDAILNLPNAFAPGNGPNGTFKILKRGIAELQHFRIYDRWGVMVFEAKNIDDGWDGTYKGAPQPMGVYMYEVSAISSSTGREFVKKGNITLLR